MIMTKVIIYRDTDDRRDLDTSHEREYEHHDDRDRDIEWIDEIHIGLDLCISDPGIEEIHPARKRHDRIVDSRKKYLSQDKCRQARKEN